MPVREAAPAAFAEESAPPDLPERKTEWRANRGLGMVLANSFGEKIEFKEVWVWTNPTRDTARVFTYRNKPYNQSLGLSTFYDVTYVGMTVDMFLGKETWPTERRPASTNSIANFDVDAYFISMSFGVFGRYPVAVSDNITWFPIAGIYYWLDLCSEIMTQDQYAASDRDIFGYVLEEVQFKFGAGFDVALGKALFLRSEALYNIGIPTKSVISELQRSYSEIKKSGLPQGFTVRVSLGWWKSIGK
jgi:hypothetical protein